MTRTEVSDVIKSDSEPVANGDSNDISRSSEKASIIEEKKTDDLETAPTTNGTKEETEKIPKPELQVVENKDELKFNGNGIGTESSEIEVKSENENLTAHSQTPTEISTQSLPPPLPISPQPSQVMVFALNDNNDPQEKIENKSPPNDLNVTPQLQIPSLIETAPTPEVEKKEEITPDIVKDIPVTISAEESTVNRNQTVSVTIEQMENEVELIKTSEVVTTSETGISTEDLSEPTMDEKVEVIKEKMEENAFSQITQTPEEQAPPSLKEKEQVAECLVEEITQTAVGIVEEQLNNGDLPSSHLFDLEVPTAELNGTNGHGSCIDLNNTTPPSTPDLTTSKIVDDHLTLKVNN